MKSVSKLLCFAGSAALAAGLTLTAAGTASATSVHGVCGGDDDNVVVCNDYDPRGYNASMRVIPWGSNIDGHTFNFNLVCGSKRFGDDAPFVASAQTEFYSYTFAVGSQGTCRVWLYDRTTGASWATPTVTR